MVHSGCYLGRFWPKPGLGEANPTSSTRGYPDTSGGRLSAAQEHGIYCGAHFYTEQILNPYNHNRVFSESCFLFLSLTIDSSTFIANDS